MRAAAAVAAVAAAALLAGCAGVAAEPPAHAPTVEAPPLEPVSGDVPEAVRAEVPLPASSSVERRAQELTLRVRNVTCEGLSTGSGFALSETVLVTNRHVLAGAERLEVSTWDGRTLEVASARVGVLGDLGLVVVDGVLPRPGTWGDPPQAGDAVAAVGYPRGGPLTVTRGTVVDRVRTEEGEVVRVTAQVAPGNSGGPLLDARGDVVGIVYALERGTGLGLAFPVDTLLELVEVGGYDDVPPCGRS